MGAASSTFLNQIYTQTREVLPLNLSQKKCSLCIQTQVSHLNLFYNKYMSKSALTMVVTYCSTLFTMFALYSCSERTFFAGNHYLYWHVFACLITTEKSEMLRSCMHFSCCNSNYLNTKFIYLLFKFI